MLLLAAVSLYMPEYEPDALAEATHLNKAQANREINSRSAQKQQKTNPPHESVHLCYHFQHVIFLLCPFA